MRDAIANGKKLLRESSVEDDDIIREKIDQLKDKSEAVAMATGEKLTQVMT